VTSEIEKPKTHTFFGKLVARLVGASRGAELARLQQSTNREHLRLLMLMDSLEDAVYITDAEGRVLLANDVAKSYFEMPDNALGRELSEVLHLFERDDPKMSRVDILKTSSTVPRRRDLRLLIKEGNAIDVDIYVTKIMEDANTVAEYIVICNDISHERTLEEQRNGFIAIASHELRTPLTIVKSALETALEEDKDMSQSTREVLEQAQRNTLQLANILTDFAIMAEAQGGDIPIQLGWVNPTQLVDQCAAEFAPVIEQRGMVLKKNVADNLPLLMTTEHYLREILQNYVSNALKFSQKGTITIAAEAWGDGVRFSVSDEGIGISKKDQKLLFTKFFTAEDYMHHQTGSVGLGLYLCKELASRIDAQIWFTSKPNEGSAFYLDVPKQSNVGKDQGEIIKTQVANLLDGI